MAKIIMFVGGMRSGKSRLAETRAAQFSRVSYLATMQIIDNETKERVDKHQQRRPANWQTIEAPLDLQGGLQEVNKTTEAILLDCLTNYLSNALLAKTSKVSSVNSSITEILKNFSTALEVMHQHHSREIIIVTNEVGSGIIPESALGRAFIDLQGWANQMLAEHCSEVYQIQFGLSTQIK